LLITALWMAIHPYLGVVHDSMIYTLFAMARLHPALQHDFFVVNGVQDHYTLFSPLYAAAIRLLGLDRAAALFVLATQIAFFGAVWLVVRRVGSVDRALLGLGLLIVLPSWYGANMAFYHIEMFPTPRQPAEAFVLLGMYFLMSSRRRSAAACLFASALLHPIIAGAGITFWIMWGFVLRRPGAAITTGLIGIGLAALVTVLPHSPVPRFDHDWLNDLTHRQAFLFPTLWSMTDWARPTPGLATLLVGALAATGPAVRRLCTAALATVLIGLTIAIVGGDILHVTVAVQFQMWRWLWLSGVISALLLPVITLDLWKAGVAARAAVLALVASWLATQPMVVFTAVALACIAAVVLTRDEQPFRSADRSLMLAACATLAVAGGFLVLDWHGLAHRIRIAPMVGSHFAVRIGQLRMLTSSAPLCAIVLYLLWHAARTTLRHNLVMLGLGSAACAVMLPYAWVTWTRGAYPAEATANFASWGRVIPENAEVLWPDSPPLALWYSLRRASYFSPVQMAGIVFSRQDWEIGHLREGIVMGHLPQLGGSISGSTTGNVKILPSQKVFDSICRARGTGFFASWRDLGSSPFPTLAQFRPQTGRSEPLHLYYCARGPA